MTLAEVCPAVTRPPRRSLMSDPALALAALSRLRRTASRLGPQLRVGLLLLAIAALTTAAAWLCWQAMIEQRLSLGGEQVPSTSGSLETSLVAEPAPATASTPALTRPRSSGPGAESTVTSPRALGRQGGLAVGGPVLATGASGGVVAIGAAASCLVLRRRRPEAADDAVQPLPPVAPVLAEPSAEDEPEGVPDAQPAPDPASEAAPENPADVPSGQTPASASRSGSPSAYAPVPLALAGLDGWVVPREQLSTDLASAGHRLYERRSAQRHAFEQDAQVVLGEHVWKVRTIDLSESGLGCQATAGEDAPSLPLPKPRTRVLVRLQLGDQAVALAAEVVWRRTTRQGQEMGLSFAGPSEAELEALHTACRTR